MSLLQFLRQITKLYVYIAFNILLELKGNGREKVTEFYGRNFPLRTNVLFSILIKIRSEQFSNHPQNVGVTRIIFHLLVLEAEKLA